MKKWLLAGAALCCVLTVNAANAASSGSLLRLSLTDLSASDDGSLDPFYGKINPFYGKINPFYGKINPFYGKINPFWGDITPFWGDIDPFYGKINPFYGDVDAFWGKINPFDTSPFWSTIMPFWRDAGPQWGDLNTAWNALQDANGTDYSGVQLQLNAFIGQSEAFWAPAVLKATGKNFNDGFASAMLAKYGIDPNNAASLAGVSPQIRSAFMLNWYDGLMSFTGVDHVDWWMPAINWSPMLTEIQGGHSIVGVLDSSFTRDASDVGGLKFTGGYNFYVNDHGAAVASLIAAQRDGQGVMGIAPDAEVHLYNPFDASGTASWSDVATGISALYKSGATVVNASLGISGSALSSEWSSILTGSLLSSRKHDLVLVKAAGNDGVVQTSNIAWGDLFAPGNLIVVGSTSPSGEISSFSNSPGEACITVLGLCAEANKLKYRFIVAPGELILVSDNHGGVVRMSGTSFAAPLVTGAVALLQERWPWLQQHADETVQIILRSASDLGAPGVDAVYGWGMLDVEASQSPLDFNNLVVYQPYAYSGKQVTTPLLVNWSSKSLKSAVLSPGQLNLWQKQSAFVVAFEPIGLTYRDFTIPLSSLLVGKNQKVNGADNPFQSYLYQRLIDWANGVKSLNFNAQTTQLGDGAWTLAMTGTQASPEEMHRGEGSFHSEFMAANREAGISVRLGEGDGAHALLGDNGFTLRSDFATATGGVNPMLGFASGGAYAQASFALGRDVNLKIGFSRKTDNHTYIDPMYGRLQDMPLPTSTASASVMGIAYDIGDGFKLNASWTHLDEANGLLGAQGGGPLSFSDGAKTDAATLGATTSFGHGWVLSGSATFAHTKVPAETQAILSLSDGGLLSSAYEIGVAKTGVFAEADSLRLTLTQPLHVEAGSLQYRSLQVVDRATGALGPLTETWNVSGKRELRLEAIYGVPVLEGRGEIAGFGLVDVNAPNAYGAVSLSLGAQVKFGF